MKKTYTILEVSHLIGVEPENLKRFIEHEWVSPAEQSRLDQEDLARISLILELEKDLGVNEESMPIILHLLDQLHGLRNRLYDYSLRSNP